MYKLQSKLYLSKNISSYHFCNTKSQLAELGETFLSQISQLYHNYYCNTIYFNHRELRRLLERLSVTTKGKGMNVGKPSPPPIYTHQQQTNILLLRQCYTLESLLYPVNNHKFCRNSSALVWKVPLSDTSFAKLDSNCKFQLIWNGFPII